MQQSMIQCFTSSLATLATSWTFSNGMSILQTAVTKLTTFSDVPLIRNTLLFKYLTCPNVMIWSKSLTAQRLLGVIMPDISKESPCISLFLPRWCCLCI